MMGFKNIEKVKSLARYIISIFGFLLAVSVFFLPVVNPDLFWHLSAGRYMAENFKIPGNDFLSWTRYGAEWINFEWLTQLIYYFLFLGGKMFALFGLKILIFILVLFVFLKILRLYAITSSPYSPLVLPVLACGLLPSTDLRPENWTLLFFATELYFLEKFRLNGFPEKKHFIAYAFLFFIVWANLHAGYAYGLALIGFYFLGEIFQENLEWIYGKEKQVRFNKGPEFLKYLIAGLAGSFINPHGWKIYKVLFQHRKYLDVLQEHILEWKPFDLTNAYQWPFITVLLAGFAFILFAFIKKRNVPFAHIISFLYFAVSSASHSRHSPFLVLTALTFIMHILSKHIFDSDKKRDIRGRGLPLGLTPKGTVPFVIFFISIICYFKFFIWTQYAHKPSAIPQSSQSLVTFLKDNSTELKNLKMFNYWGWGGFLGFHLHPEYKVFMDGRYIFHDFLEETQKVQKTIKTWNNFLNKYQIELVIAEREDNKIIIKQKQSDETNKLTWKPAYMFYLPRKKWAVVHWDKKVIVFVKRSSVNRTWLAGNEFKLLMPDDTLNLAVSSVEGKTSLKEIQKEVGLYLSRSGAFSESGAGDYVIEWWRTLKKTGVRPLHLTF